MDNETPIVATFVRDVSVEGEIGCVRGTTDHGEAIESKGWTIAQPDAVAR